MFSFNKLKNDMMHTSLVNYLPLYFFHDFVVWWIGWLFLYLWFRFIYFYTTTNFCFHVRKHWGISIHHPDLPPPKNYWYENSALTAHMVQWRFEKISFCSFLFILPVYTTRTHYCQVSLLHITWLMDDEWRVSKSSSALGYR